MQHSAVSSPIQKPIEISVGGEPLGVVLPSPEGFKFLAVKYPVFSLDGKIFETVEAARAAAGQIVNP